MPKVSFRMASAYREWVFGVQTNTARKIHRSDHTEGRLTTAPPRERDRCQVMRSTSRGCSHRAAARGDHGPGEGALAWARRLVAADRRSFAAAGAFLAEIREPPA